MNWLEKIHAALGMNPPVPRQYTTDNTSRVPYAPPVSFIDPDDRSFSRLELGPSKTIIISGSAEEENADSLNAWVRPASKESKP